ncbi:MAG TPA: MerR family transcriptional regulator [Syntrophaceticus sp.]|nr:MerR family transcriptional regulator [Syntrophaceticus sp.]
MELKNCPQCGKVFARISRDLCPDCIAQEDEIIKQIQQYLDEHHNATITDISEGTGIPTDKIIVLLQEGRLITRENSGLLKCERCGKSIPRGRFCSECSTTLSKLFSSSREDSKQKVYVREYHKKLK